MKTASFESFDCFAAKKFGEKVVLAIFEIFSILFLPFCFFLPIQIYPACSAYSYSLLSLFPYRLIRVTRDRVIDFSDSIVNRHPTGRQFFFPIMSLVAI